MFDGLERLFAGAPEEAEITDEDEQRLAVAALLVEAARMDHDFDADERSQIADLLIRRFGIDEKTANGLLDEAEAHTDDSVELYKYTATVKNAFDHDARIELIEMLWEVVYADGEVHHLEENLMRRLGGLLYVTDQERGAAKKRVEARLAASRG